MAAKNPRSSGSFVRLNKLRFGLEGLAEVKLNLLELLHVQAGEVVQNSGPLPGKPHAHEAAILPPLVFVNQAFPASPLHKSHYRVVAFLQKLRQFADGCPAAAGVSRNPQKQDILLGGQTVLTRGPLAKTKKAAKIVAEPGKATDCKGVSFL